MNNYNKKEIINKNNVRILSSKEQYFFESQENGLWRALVLPIRNRIRKEYPNKKNENEIKELEGIKSSVLNFGKQEE